MAQSFKETAHLKTDLKKLHENWDQIDWSKTYKEQVAINQPDINELRNYEQFADVVTGEDIQAIGDNIQKLKDEAAFYKEQSANLEKYHHEQTDLRDAEINELKERLKEAEEVILKSRMRLESVICDCERYRNRETLKLIREHQTKWKTKHVID